MVNKTYGEGKDDVAKLCKYFATNQKIFSAPGVKEAHVRQNLIDPLFRALGWDVGNADGVAPQYCEVIVEDSLDIEGQQKAPDYTFRVGTLPKFYVEAKKCGVNINSDPAPAYQLRRYGWSAKVALSILTDFEELAVYDCTLRPAPNEKPSFARIQYYNFQEYPDRWREIWDIFSREAVWSGAYDQYAASKRKRGTSEVDVEFLKEIEGWREELARNIALRNHHVSNDELNRAVQLTIDRLVFLRMAEDRGLESNDQLLTLCNQPGIYDSFMKLCRKADDKYNSGLFHFQKEPSVSEAPDKITPGLTIDDKVFKPILQSLYFAYGSPYEFKVLPVEILGTVYERFLGKVIRLTAGHQAKIEDKPEVRKAGGVYYTPAYIVNYIVGQTVGRQIEGKSPGQLAGKGKAHPLRVLDMACGSGSFLLGAYQCLLDHYLKWYIDNDPKRFPKAVYSARVDDWRLTIAEKKRILTTHIFGVDIDPQAVEVSKLSLLLKVLEGENAQTVGQQLKLIHIQRMLPNLSDNIKCGNSLIGPDYFTGRLISDPEEFARVNAFDWNREFPAVMKDGGFDCVIGNPPWVSLSGRFGNDICQDQEVEYLKHTYHGNTYMPNMYEYFVAKGASLVINGGQFGYIVPDRLGFNQQFVSLREYILKSFKIISLLYKTPFPGVTADTLIFILERGVYSDKFKILASEYGKSPVEMLQKDYLDAIDHRWIYFSDKVQMRLSQRIMYSPLLVPLSDLCKTTSGYGGKSEFVMELQQNSRQIPTFKGDSIVRYRIRKQYWFEFTPENITGRTTDKSKLGAKPKILLRKTGTSIIATYDESGIFPEQSLYFIFDCIEDLSLLYILGILNSRLIGWYYNTVCLTNKDSIAQVKKVNLDQLPIRRINPKANTDKVAHDCLVKLVESMLVLQKQAYSAKSEAQRGAIQRQIEATDAEIDRLVYDLYGLTKEEIAIVEGATA